ncbi:MAG: 2-C-methyl-D-erythritol 4-phosphate cytidylyltransferase [Actinomycetota bacterium]|nr:2-C-methyl-D-erythritol 4-phosphate cytidylyltransferase [Actinomycetota bacterium]
MNVAIIVAAGKGIRMGPGPSKQYLPLLGKPVLAHTLLAFEKARSIDEVVLVVGQGEEGFCKEEIVDNYGFYKVKKIVEGGPSRQDSVMSGIKEVPYQAETIMIHDGARPLISSHDIEMTFVQLKGCDGVVLGAPVTETIKLVKEGVIKDTLDRSEIWAAQTPQLFLAEVIIASYRAAMNDGAVFTDDSALAERLGYRIKMADGSYENIKITTEKDLILAEMILKKREVT